MRKEKLRSEKEMLVYISRKVKKKGRECKNNERWQNAGI